MIFLKENIKHIRTKTRLCQEKFAIDLEVSRSAISSYEIGKSKPSILFLLKLSEYSKIDLDSLVKKKLNKLEL